MGIDANHDGSCGGGAADDEISFVCFKAILTGTVLDFTDNGWQRINANQWGNTEGTIRMTRTGGTVLAGVVMTLSVDDSKVNAAAGRYSIVSPDGDWSFTEINFTRDFNMNSGGDQIYFMQGGTWNGGTYPNHDATYTGGNVLFGFSTTGAWEDFGASTQKSGLYPGLDCFSMAPTSSSDFDKYTGLLTAATKLTWIGRINNPANWTSYSKCKDYADNGPDYVGGEITIVIESGGGSFNEGEWTGAAGNTDWFECGNWGNMTVPDETVNVSLPSSGPTIGCNIGDPAPSGNTEASCNNLTNDLSGLSFTIDNAASILHIYGDFTNNSTFSHTDGLVTFKGSSANQTIGGSSNSTFYNLTIDNTGYNIDLSKPVTVNNTLTLTDGIVNTTATNLLTIDNSGSVSGANDNSHVNGPVAKNTNSTTKFTFPTGNGTTYRLIAVTPSSTAATTWTAEYFDTDFGNYSFSGLVESVTDVDNWELKRSGSANSTIELSWNSSHGVTIFTNLLVAHYNTGSEWWESAGGNNYTGNNASGTVESNPDWSSYSRFKIGDSDGQLLPIELLYLTAVCKNGIAEINWATASEINNDYFTLEKCRDDACLVSTNNWEIVTIVNGAGNSNTVTSYSIIDVNPYQTTYYRLKQTDYDGAFEYFNTISTTCVQGELVFEFIGVTPQDNDGFITVLFTSDEGHSYRLELYDILGRIITTERTSESVCGLNTMKVNTGDLPGGIYLIVLQNSETVSKKIILH